MFSHVRSGPMMSPPPRSSTMPCSAPSAYPRATPIPRVASSIAPRPACSRSQKPIDGEDATHANGGTIGFACDSPEKVRAFHEAGVANGGKSIEDPPGWRDGPFGKLYLAYLRDPYGNKVCALHRG